MLAFHFVHSLTHHQSNPRSSRTRLLGGTLCESHVLLQPSHLPAGRAPQESHLKLSHAGDPGTQTVPPMQPEQKARWEEAAEAAGGPRQQDMQPPRDSRHHSKVTVSNPSWGVELEPATTLYRRPEALLLTQNSS